MLNYSRPWHMCVKADEEVFERKNCWEYLHFHPVSFSHAVWHVGHRFFPYNSWVFNCSGKFYKVVFVLLWVPVSTQMDLWWFWRLVAALWTCRRSFASQRLHAWPPLILFIYIHRHLRRKPLGLVHADSERDLHRVINSCSHLSRWGAFQEFSGTRCGWERWPH